MNKELPNNPPIPEPTLDESITRLQGINQGLKKAMHNREAIENGSASEEAMKQDSKINQIESLIKLGDSHKALSERTIPIFSIWQERWKDDVQHKLVQKEEILRSHIVENHLPHEDMKRGAIVFQEIRNELNMPESQTDVLPEKLHKREFNQLVYERSTQHGTKKRILDIPETMDERDYALLINLIKGTRPTTFTASKILNRELTEQFGTKDSTALIHRINRLREWVGDISGNPKLIEQVGERSLTEYRFAYPAQLIQATAPRQRPVDDETDNPTNEQIDSAISKVPLAENIPLYAAPEIVPDVPITAKENPIEKRDPEVRQKLRDDLEKVVEQIRTNPATTLQISNGLKLDVRIVNRIVNTLKLKSVGRKDRYPLYDRVGAMIVEYGRDYDWRKNSLRPNEVEALKHVAIEIFTNWQEEQSKHQEE